MSMLWKAWCPPLRLQIWKRKKTWAMMNLMDKTISNAKFQLETVEEPLVLPVPPPETTESHTVEDGDI